MFGKFALFIYLCIMNQMMTILTQRELFLLIIGTITYVALFVVTWQNSHRKMLMMQDRLNKVQAMQKSEDVEDNRRKIEELERLIAKLGSENSMLRLELEEKKARLDYANTIARIESEKRERAEGDIFGSDIYLKIQRLLNEGKTLGEDDWQQLAMLVDGIYTGFTEKLYSLYRLSANDYHVCLLIKVRIPPKDIALLTAHSKESVATTRSRLYQKIFGKKGATKEWDDFILSL
jgi:regulator of replication initiation timing